MKREGEKRLVGLIIGGLVLGLWLIVGPGCDTGPRTFRETRSLMGTYVTITIQAGSREKAARAVEAGFSEVARLEKLLSTWRDDSELSRVNAEASEGPVKVSMEVLELSNKALDIARMTDGAFDPTMGPLIKLWNVTRRSAPPAQKEIDAAGRTVGYKDVVIEHGTIRFLKRGMSFDLGGIAKGYTADRVVSILKSLGIHSGIVAVAGDVKVFGGGLRESPWRVGIKDPRNEGLAASVELSDRPVSTSGDYERYFVSEGKRYHHLLSPETGFPAEGLMSVSIIHPKAVMCDGLATGLFVLGPERAFRKLEDLNLAGVIIDGEGKLSVSPAAKDVVRLEGNQEDN